VIGRAAALGWGSGAGGRETVELRDRGEAGARGARGAGGFRVPTMSQRHTRTSTIMNSFDEFIYNIYTINVITSNMRSGHPADPVCGNRIDAAISTAIKP